MKKHLIIIGFMGTGKTSVGQILSHTLDMEHLDTDVIIERDRDSSIPDIFKDYGELTFRNIETGVIEQAVQNTHPSIITTGGGIVLRSENRVCMNKFGWVFALDAQPKEIIDRLQSDTSRPLLQGGTLEDRVYQLYDKRKPFYQFADYTISTSHLSETQVADQIANIWFNLMKSGDAK
jgi:shikimate kinase